MPVKDHIALKDYVANRPNMISGGLIEIASPGIVGGCIRLRTGQLVNHTMVIIRFNEFWPGRVSVVESLNNGPVTHFLSDRLLKLQSEGGKAWWLPLLPEYQHFGRQVAAECLAFASKDIRYDWLAIFRQFFAREKKVGLHRLFCSEMAYAANIRAGLPMIPQKYVPRPGEMSRTGVYGKPIQIL